LQKVAETLDVRKGLDPSFLWPPPEPQKPPEGDVAGETAPEEVKEPGWEEQPVRDKLLTVLTYLRSQHSYCLHCGCQVCMTRAALAAPVMWLCGKRSM